ncbi:PREDICTED: F-box only protein 28 [Polistes canadensis]|uniref:F-box only protein 28 n=1 Tax=Polistes canadensis TaxID=91411 RepID=UPI000718F2E9|nr:PREDICTED: F-box only protein 28 [Polistes canadensis]XP_014611746.1 PREDICTED: F-box only protein 28 [Polistes canadensis]XP_014611747.1 PREDICTED: F-box only protein 28 [Polistes canadensis]
MLNIVDLPDIVLETILSNLTYDEISKYRIICKRFDRICRKLLNRGFNLMEKYHAQCLRAVKSQLPRRESERRSHPLARHCDILTAIETRISMLSMTFIKYVDLNLCCFIPGKVIDEIFRVLRLIRDSKTPPRAHEILQELRDISSMAMEHFDEKILPDLKHSICTSVVSNVGSYELPGGSLMISHHTASSNSASLSHSYSTEKLNQTFKKIYSRTKRNKFSVMYAKFEITKMKLRMKKQLIQMRVQNLKLQKQAKKINDQDMQLAEMKKHLEEWEQKMGDLTAELSRAREETQKPDSIDSCKRKHIDICNQRDSDSLQTKELEAKKRKLIVERKPSNDAKDVKFKKFISGLLAGNALEGYPSTSY